MSVVPERHPGTDQLADLAAEVLPADVARSVEAHVRACTLCAGLLADAERVRRLLFTQDPGPMPTDVWLRLEGALAAEAINRHRAPDDDAAAAGNAGWFDTPTTTPPAGGYSVTQARGFEAPPLVPPAADDPTLTRPHAIRPRPYDPPADRAPAAYPDAYASPYPETSRPAYPESYSEGYPESYPEAYPESHSEGWSDPYAQTPGQPAPEPYRIDVPTPALPPAAALPAPAAAVTPEPAPAAPVAPPAPAPGPASGGATAPQAVPPLATPPAPPPSMSFDEAPTAAWKAFLDEPEPVAPITAPVPLRVGRVVRSSVRSRRDVRTEDKDAGRRRRPMLLAAAAAALLVVVGGGGVFLLWHGDGGSTGTVGTDDLPGKRRSVVTTSGQEYTALSLVGQVRTLIGQPAPTASPSGAPVPSGSPSGSSTSASGPSTSHSGSPGAARPTPIPTAGTVADPAQLQSCLAGLGEKDRRPLAVDLGRYQGRDAAVIVLPGRVGGFDIWVVSRQCTSGKETALAFKSVPQ